MYVYPPTHPPPEVQRVLPLLATLCCRYKVRYSEYGNEETIAWTRLKRLAETPPPPPPTVTQPTVAEVRIPRPPTERETPQQAEEEIEAAPPFAGMRPRALCVESNKNPSKREAQASGAGEAVVETADVVNPVLLSATPNPAGRKLSWKDKLAARKKKAAGGGAGGEANGGGGVHVLPKKQVSLVRDFAAQRREQQEQVDRKMDKSEWRTKVAFGLTGKKPPS